jgi:hypothetical protein
MLGRRYLTGKKLVILTKKLVILTESLPMDDSIGGTLEYWNCPREERLVLSYLETVAEGDGDVDDDDDDDDDDQNDQEEEFEDFDDEDFNNRRQDNEQEKDGSAAAVSTDEDGAVCQTEEDEAVSVAVETEPNQEGDQPGTEPPPGGVSRLVTARSEGEPSLPAAAESEGDPMESEGDPISRVGLRVRVRAAYEKLRAA